MVAVSLVALLALTCVRAEIHKSDDVSSKIFHRRRSIEPASGNRNGGAEVVGCMYSGRWFAQSARVVARDACLRCRCAHGALSCARASCAPTPDPPPRRCAVLHRRGVCCPELHCPDGVRSLELEASGRMEEAALDVATPAAPGHACVEEGAVFAAGSALATRAACEQCFCLQGARRCVRPRCLPPPPGCSPRPAPGACCPARYYCEPPPRNTTTTSAPRAAPAPRVHDCSVNGLWVREGEQTPSKENCTQCFCLRGAVRCQPLTCAPALRGCRPLLHPGHCCPHQYHCPHRHTTDHYGPLASIIPAISDNSLVSIRNDERSFHTSTSIKSDFTTKSAHASLPTTHGASNPPATTKVKRKTSDMPPSTYTSQKTTPKELKTTVKEIKTTTKETKNTPKETKTATTEFKTTSPVAASSTTEKLVKELVTTTTAKLVSSTETTTTALLAETETSTEQPEGSVRIIINGTINCTAELSSKLGNITTANETSNIENEPQARTPESGAAVEATSPPPPEIITDRNAGSGVGFVEGDSFIVNVTSSLNANSSRPLAPTSPPPVPSNITHKSNISKKTKEDYSEYDYMEPTLPPSLPNLKIIPFVAADAVVEEDEHVPAKEEVLSYPMMEREDKFPVYYPTLEHKVQFATRREDTYGPTQYPVFVSEKHSGGQVADNPPAGGPAPEPTRPATSTPARTTREQTLTTPEVNLFSPPAETEGGFIPKGPGIIDEYYAVYPSTPPPVPHLTTSMQINPDSPDKVECLTPDGRRVPEGESVWLACSVCACAWGELHCAPRRCPPPPPTCRRRPATASSADLCCGEIVCDKVNMTTPTPTLSTRRTEITLNVTNVPVEIESHLIPFDPPPDRREPEPTTSTVNRESELKEHNYTSKGNITLPTNITINTSTSLPIGEVREKPTTAMTEHTSSSEATSVTPPSTTTSPALEHKDTNFTDASSQEYEDDDDDEGFSFGSVLKLLLSDNYDTTTASPKKKLTPTTNAIPVSTTTRSPPSTSRRPPPKPAAPPFIPMQPHAYIPPKKVPLNTVNRIDHLVLGEATAIKKTTVRPATATTPFRPISTPVRRYTTRTTTRKPIVTTKTVTTQATKTEENVEYTQPSIATSPSAGVTSAPAPSGAGGLLKLAGCNIYGRMYRVGRIIAELSTPCQECRCTELGVQCLPLRC